MAFPAPQNAFFNVKFVKQHKGGQPTGYGASISKQKVNLIHTNEYGEVVEEEPFVDHQPPFLALPPVTEIKPLPIPAHKGYAKTN